MKQHGAVESDQKMTQYTPHGYLDIDQVIEMVGKSLFPDCWEDILANRDIYDYLKPKQKELIKGILDSNHSNNEPVSITISYCVLERRNPSLSENIKYGENKLSFDPSNQDNHKSMSNFYKSQEARDKIRTALSSGKINAYYLLEENGKQTLLEADLWNVDKNWYLLLLINSIYITNKDYKFIKGEDLWIPIPYGKVIFKKKDIEEFQLQNKKMDSSCDVIIVEQLLAGIKDGTIKFRGTERLYLRAKIQIHDKNNQSKPVKGSDTIPGIIENLAEDMGLTAINSIRNNFPDLNKMTPEEIGSIEQGYVTEQEKKDIARLIRPIHKQKS